MMRGHGQLTITKGRNTWIAVLSDDVTWSCDDNYLQQYLSQLSILYSDSVVRQIMQATKRDLEYGGYTVELDQSSNSVISDIVMINDDIRAFWSNAHGWAPTEAAELSAKSRLDWQVSLSHCLSGWLESLENEGYDGCLILAWVNLGCLVEGTLKFFLSVYIADYSKSPRTRGKRKELCDIDNLQLEEMKQYFAEHIWADTQKHWTGWIGKVQQRRNAVHAYRDRDIGTFDEFFAELATYLDFLIEIEGQTPRP